MPRKRRPQSFSGLVRERFAEIERELARGIDQQTVLVQLLGGVTSIGTFRDTLYRVRRRVATSHGTPNVKQQVATGLSGEPNRPRDSGSAVSIPGPPRLLREKRSNEEHGKQEKAASTAQLASLTSHREYLEWVRTFNDKDII